MLLGNTVGVPNGQIIADGYRRPNSGGQKREKLKEQCWSVEKGNDLDSSADFGNCSFDKKLKYNIVGAYCILET